ncbi:MAG: hypothetical protein FJY65_03440, partial [Calditrichaeota bacterium]|nr:hypothetical protein [Calditrichota bacterium]
MRRKYLNSALPIWLSALLSTASIGQLRVAPYGLTADLPNDRTVEIPIILSNEEQSPISFRTQFEKIEFEQRRDDPRDLRALIFTDGAGWGGVHAFQEGAAAAGLPNNQITEIGSGQAANVNLGQYNIVLWADAHSNDFYQQYNRNRGRFEEWVNDG